MTIYREEAMDPAIDSFDFLFANHMSGITTLYLALP
jgi:hypothetical protein